MADLQLTAEQEAQAQRIAKIIARKLEEEALAMARLLVAQPDPAFFGASEFELRARVHQIGAHALQTALEERKKGGITARA